MSIDPANPRRREVFSCAYQYPVVSPDERYVAFLKGDMTVAVVDLSRQLPVAVWACPAEKQHLFLNWSPDGQEVFVGCCWGGGLWIYDPTKDEAARAMEGWFGWCTRPQPDGSRMAFERPYGQWHHEIWIVDQGPKTPKGMPELQTQPGS